MKLGEIAEFINGRAFKPEEWTDNGTPIIRIQNLNDHSKPFNYYAGEFSDKHYVRNGDVLLSWSGTPGTSFGCFSWNRGDGVLNQHIFNVKINESLCTKDYFIRAVNKNLNLLIDQAHGGVGLQHITKRKLVEIDIPLSPLNEQNKIAAILDAADELRQKDKALIAKYDELTQSLFLDMFGDPVTNPKGWGITELRESVSKLGDGLHGTPIYDDDGEYHFINGNNLNHGVIEITERTRRVSNDEYLKHRKELNVSTMLVSINGTIGKVAFYNGEKIMLGKSACYFNVKEEYINKLYLYYLIDSPYFIRYASGKATGSTIQNVSLKTMREFPVLVPLMSHQTQFAERVKEIESQKTKAQDSLNKSEDLFNSLLQKAFKGELTN